MRRGFRGDGLEEGGKVGARLGGGGQGGRDGSEVRGGSARWEGGGGEVEGVFLPERCGGGLPSCATLLTPLTGHYSSSLGADWSASVPSSV